MNEQRTVQNLLRQQGSKCRIPFVPAPMRLLFIVCLAHWYRMNLIECYYSTG